MAFGIVTIYTFTPRIILPSKKPFYVCAHIIWYTIIMVRHLRIENKAARQCQYNIYWIFVYFIRMSYKLKLYLVTTTRRANKTSLSEFWFTASIAIPLIYFCYAGSHAYLYSPRAHFLPTHLSTDSTLWTILTQIGDIIIYNILYSRTCGKPILHCYYYNILYDDTYVGLRRKLVLKLPKINIFINLHII